MVFSFSLGKSKQKVKISFSVMPLKQTITHPKWVIISKPRFVSSYTIGNTEGVGSEQNGDQSEEKCENKDRKE